MTKKRKEQIKNLITYQNIKNTFFCIVSVLFLYCAGTTLYSKFVLDVTYKSNNFTSTNTMLSNPYQGFYHLYGYMLSEAPTEPVDEWCDRIISSDKNQLVFLEVNLMNYRSESLSGTACTQLHTILSSFSKADKQIILRFVYDWDGNALATEPDSIDMIISHIEQTADIVNAYSSNIYIVQGNFTGDYGEMHNTHFGTADELKQLISTLNDKLNPEIKLAVRTPAHWRTICNTFYPLDDDTKATTDISTRLSLYNDGMMGSEFDTGTYDDTPIDFEIEDYSQQGTRKQEMNFQDLLCQYIPNGGEAIIDNKYNDISKAVSYLKKIHVSYLNMDYDLDVLNKWKNSNYNNMNGYDYIASHLGYRYTVKKSSLSFNTLWDNFAKLKFSFSNSGFSPSYRNFDTELIVFSVEKNKTISTEALQIDTRNIVGDDTYNVTTNINIRDYKKGTYKFYFRMKDASTKQVITFANKDFDSSMGMYLGSLKIK